MFKVLFKFLGRGKKLSILIYHQVLPQFDPMRPYEMHADLFEQQLTWLKQNFTLLSLKQAATLLEEGNLPKNAAVITFDDGYENNASVALPILAKHNTVATFFIASDFLNGGTMWNDIVIEYVRNWPHKQLALDEFPNEYYITSDLQEKHQTAEKILLRLKYLPFVERSRIIQRLQPLAAPDGLMMSDEQVIELHQAGMEIGGHTCSHPILAKLDDDSAKKQIKNNKDYLENLLDEQLFSFAYPNGKPQQDYLLRDVKLVEQVGYKCAVSTANGVSTKTTDKYQLLRFSPWKQDKLGFLVLLAKNYF
ncbi:polysaccharide deacetylase family protein [Aliiglaciecola sp. SL4]|uniref:polysaccharide deacetylase family protein n=1 Tax=Aliiglaciecola sp. SL4 TaxID=3239806 RepID=UPI00355BCC52